MCVCVCLRKREREREQEKWSYYSDEEVEDQIALVSKSQKSLIFALLRFKAWQLVSSNLKDALLIQLEPFASGQIQQKLGIVFLIKAWFVVQGKLDQYTALNTTRG